MVDATRALYSVPNFCDDGCEVYFAATGALVTTGGKIVTRFAREGGLYCAEMEIKRRVGEKSPFVGPDANA